MCTVKTRISWLGMVYHSALVYPHSVELIYIYIYSNRILLFIFSTAASMVAKQRTEMYRVALFNGIGFGMLVDCVRTGPQ